MHDDFTISSVLVLRLTALMLPHMMQFAMMSCVPAARSTGEGSCVSATFRTNVQLTISEVWLKSWNHAQIDCDCAADPPMLPSNRQLAATTSPAFPVYTAPPNPPLLLRKMQRSSVTSANVIIPSAAGVFGNEFVSWLPSNRQRRNST